MIGNTKLYLAPKNHGSMLYGCAPTVGGWWTDLWNAVEKAGSVVIPGYSTVIQAQAQAEATKAGVATSTSSDNLVKYGIIAGLGLLAVMALKKG